MSIESTEHDLTLVEAVARYAITKSRLQQLLTTGHLPGYKVKGPRVREWRVTAEALEAAGFERRPQRVIDLRDEDLTAVVRRLADEVRAQRRRADRLDGELGHARFTISVLQAQLVEAGMEPRRFGDQRHPRPRPPSLVEQASAPSWQ